MTTFTNFRFDLDEDGIALVTWDMPDRSMNVITPEVMDELSRIVETVATDGAIKGCVITSGKDSFSGGADLAMLQGLRAEYGRLKKEKGEEETINKVQAIWRRPRNEVKDEFGDRVTMVVIPGAGHALVPEAPEAVVDAIVKWEKSLPRANPQG